ncbi:PRC-barrel domain containing protein [Aquabacterium sp. A08]|nr:PRC-barrel domain-containing protein [Aquabacterium sp. A08]NIC40888.1 PRC-barrel domain containing protein [Aquabacterium sp. A08]
MFSTAQSTTASGSGPDARHGPGPYLMGAKTLIGNDVYNKESLDLGDIKEIMLDMRTGRVSYAVLSFGGFFMGMGEKLFAVPWGAMTLDTDKKCFVLDVKREKLENAPGFDPKHWPDMADEKWEASIHSFYGTRPSNGQAPL